MSYKFSSSFQSTFIPNKQQSKDKKPKSQSKDKVLFKLDPKSGKTIESLPVDMLRKKSKQKLQSLKDSHEGNKDWSIFNAKNETQNLKDLKNQKPIGKTYNFGKEGLDKRRKSKEPNMEDKKQVEVLPHDIVRPSKLVKPEQQTQNLSDLKTPTIFQTPLLPCFKSQLSKTNLAQTQNKTIAEKEGIWKIGKIKITKKGNKIMKSTLNINGIEFEANAAESQGKIISILGSNLYELKDWSGFWVVEPKQELFASQRDTDAE